MKPIHMLLLLLGLACVALWLGEGVGASGLLVAAAGWALYQQHRNDRTIQQFRQGAEEQTRDDHISYAWLILTAMDWGACGKTAYVPPDDDPANPQVVYVGYTVPSALGEGQTFLPELAVSERHIEAVQALGTAAERVP